MLLIQTFSATAKQSQKVYEMVDLMDDVVTLEIVRGAIYRRDTTIEEIPKLHFHSFIMQMSQILCTGIAYAVAITDLEDGSDVTAQYVNYYNQSV